MDSLFKIGLQLSFIFYSLASTLVLSDVPRKESRPSEIKMAHFRREHPYNTMFEPATFKEAKSCYDLIRWEYPELLQSMEVFRKNDSIGNPVTFDFGKAGWFSPTTMRHILMAGELAKNFCELGSMNIVEIGGGYGGLCRIIHETSGYKSYTLLDRAENLEFAKKYLSRIGIKNVRFGTVKDLSKCENVDLIIVNPAYTIIEQNEFNQFMTNVLSYPRGYIFKVRGIQPPSLSNIISTLCEAGKTGALICQGKYEAKEFYHLVWKQPTDPFKGKTDTPMKSLKDSDVAISYNFSGGRFGDNVLAYVHAKWISYKYNIPMLYRPFNLSEQLKLHTTETKKMANDISLREENEINPHAISTVFTVPFFPENRIEYEVFNFSNPVYFIPNWQDPLFQQELAKDIMPKRLVDTLSLPTDRITVGVHIRRGGGFDHLPSAVNTWPLKFPGDDFYIKQLQRLIKIFHYQPMYVYLFTDDKNPELLAAKYSKAIGNKNIEFDYRREGNGPSANILEDYCSMQKFDCFIRADSNFSRMATAVKNYMVKVAPTHAKKVDREYVIDEVEILFDGSFFDGSFNNKF